MNVVRTLIAACAMTVALVSVADAQAPMQESRGNAVIAIEKAALEKWGHGDPGGLLKVYSPDITYFDESTRNRIDGLPAMEAYYKPRFGTIKWASWEMIDPKVQTSGDVAVLTYRLNAVGTERGVPTTHHWNSTSVYVHGKDGWKMIHSHWSYVEHNGD